MAKKVFTSKFFTNLFYEVLEEMWIDDDTYVIVFQDMVDKDYDTFHLEVEYHKDEDRVTFTRVYEHENVSGDYLVAADFKKDIEEYILKQVGVINGMLAKQKIAVELTLDVDPSMSIDELNEWLMNLKLKFPLDGVDRIKVIKQQYNYEKDLYSYSRKQC